VEDKRRAVLLMGLTLGLAAVDVQGIGIRDQRNER
jgi:hypothetical protein